MTTHYLKTWPGYFGAIRAGIKTFEVRRADRDFKVGDRLVLEEFDQLNGKYTGDAVVVTVAYLLRGPAFGIEEGFVCLSIRPVT